MLCKYRCGNEGKFENKDGSVRCSKNVGQCPVNIEKRVKTRQTTGYGHSTETKEKISKAGKGRKHTTETKEKMSNSHKERIVSEDTKEKIAQSNKEYWSTNKRVPWNKGTKGNKRFTDSLE